jgi:ATP-dependent Lhr-like helicase
MQASEEDFYRITKEEALKEFDPLDLVYPNEVPVFEKYDEYVPEELIRKGFAEGVLDVKGMKKRVLGWDFNENNLLSGYQA